MYMADKHTEGEREFLESYDPTAFDRPSLAVDVVVVGVRDGRVCALLAQRTEQPQAGRWALPGGFVGMAESLEVAASRVLLTKGGLCDIYLEQLYTFGDPGRDPRTRVVAVAYMALVDRGRLEDACSDEDAGRLVADLDVPWAGEAGGPVGVIGPDGEQLALAFDHAEILGMAVQRLRGKLDYAPVGFELLPDRFTLRQLQDIHEAILGRSLNKDSFRRRILAGGQVVATGKREENVNFRPAELYRFVNNAPQWARQRRNHG